MMSLVLGGKLRNAAELAVEVADLKARDRGQEKEGFLIPATACMDDFEALAGLNYTDLDAPPERRRLVMATLVVNRMFGLSGATGPRLLEALEGEFPCPSLVEWLKGDPCGPMAIDMIPELDDEDEGPLDKATWKPDRYLLAYLYAHTKNFEATNVSKLNRIIRQGQGVRIFRPPGAESCRMCQQDKTVYHAGELIDLPALPRHWGCRCFYTPHL